MATTVSPSTGQGALFTQAGSGASPGYGAIDLRRAALIGLQEGVLGASSFEVTQRGAGVNMSVDIAATTADSLGTGIAAIIQGDAITAQGLYPVPPHSAVINETITANASGNPRVDRVVLELKDNTHDASGSNLVQTRVIAGTATSGATLNNLTGAAAVPSSALLLADVLVATGAASIANSVIRDRRKWARGAHVCVVRSANGSGVSTALAGYAVTSSTMALLDSTNLAPRVECSGAPVRVTFAALTNPDGVSPTGGAAGYFAPQVDSVSVNGMANVGTDPSTNATSMQVILPVNSVAGSSGPPWTVNLSRTMFTCSMEFTPSAGSHIIAPAAAAVGNNFTFYANATRPLYWTVEEVLRQSTANNATTSG